MSLVDRLLLWPPLELAKSLGQRARENIALRDRVHELEHENFWLKVELRNRGEGEAT